MDSGRRQELLYVSRRPDRALHRLLERHGWAVTSCDTARQAERALGTVLPSVGLLDLMSGYADEDLAGLEATLSRHEVEWVAMPSEAQMNSVAMRRCIRMHCFDFVAMPSTAQQVVDIVGRAHAMCLLQGADVLSAARGEGVGAGAGAGVDEPMGEMIGECEAMQQLVRAIGKVAYAEAPVLVFGHGQGVDGAVDSPSLAARGRPVHGDQLRGDRAPLAAIGAVRLRARGVHGGERAQDRPRRSGQRGHAVSRRDWRSAAGEPGKPAAFFAGAHDPAPGGYEAIGVDVRIISATHVDLEAAVRAGRFRADLYHRLCVLRLEEPPLRARGRDIELLAHRMFERYRGDSPRHIRGFSAAAIKAMYRYDWPGNVRELINRVRRAIVMAESRAITPGDLELAGCVELQVSTLAEARDQAERGAIEQALARHRFRLSAAAQELEVSRATLYRLMLVHGLRGRQDEAAPQRGRQEVVLPHSGDEAAARAEAGVDFLAPPSAGELAAAASAKRPTRGRARLTFALQVASSDAAETVTL
jgi:DNA-binding NtrC family response regulator